MLLFSSPVSLFATPRAVSSKKAELEKVRNQLEQINDRLNAAVEDYNYARLRLGRTADKLARTQRQLAKAERELSKAKSLFKSRMVEIYRTDSLSLLNVVLGAADFSDFLQRLELFSRIAMADADTVARVKETRVAVEKQKASLQAVRQEQQASLREIDRRKDAIQDQLDVQQRLFASKKNELSELMAEERARQAELRREALEAARQSEARAVFYSPHRGSRQKNRSKSAVVVYDPGPANGSKAARVIRIATQYLGVPYKWGGASPSTGFDCSGFTMYVFAKVGISLPHSSRAQATMGRPVPLSQLQPGDLVFRGNPIHHVGIYIGGGRMIASPQTGDVVKISPIRNLTKARRIL